MYKRSGTITLMMVKHSYMSLKIALKLNIMLLSQRDRKVSQRGTLYKRRWAMNKNEIIKDLLKQIENYEMMRGIDYVDGIIDGLLIAITTIENNYLATN